jgi:hypothetical protein
MLPYISENLNELESLRSTHHELIHRLEALEYTPFHSISLVFFILAILHTLSTSKIHNWAKSLEAKETSNHFGMRKGRSLFLQLLFFLSEVEIVFAFWAIPLFIAITSFYGWQTGVEYINSRNYTEPLFVTVILAMASTKPIVYAAEQIIQKIASILGNSVSIWWFTLLTVGPILGSFITEPAAMALSALLLSRQFYSLHPSSKLAYATLGLLFVNISVGGVLTHFASPAVLILSNAWDWSLSYIFLQFGWKAIAGILLSNLIYWRVFRRELSQLNARSRVTSIYRVFSSKQKEQPIPIWIILVHIFFMSWIVVVGHYPALFIASFLFFIGFHQATRAHQTPINMARPMLVGLFIASLLVHGGLQGWWVVDILSDLSPHSVLGAAIALTAYNDNAAISYLSTLVPNWDEIYKYAIFTGVVAGGGLTVIANAPNPAGHAILKKHFNNEIRPLKLLYGALLPTIVLYLVFYFFGPLFNSP